MWAECKTSAAMPKASSADRAKITQAGWRTAWKNHWSKEILPHSSQNCLHYITLIYWRKLSPFFLHFDNHIILPFTRLKNKIKTIISRVSSPAGNMMIPVLFHSNSTWKNTWADHLFFTFHYFTFRINIRIILRLRYSHLLLLDSTIPAHILNHCAFFFFLYFLQRLLRDNSHYITDNLRRLLQQLLSAKPMLG